MSNSLRDIRTLLQRDLGSPDAEWKQIELFLNRHKSEADILLKWIFAEYKGYVDTRVRAGSQFLQHNLIEGRRILERLIASPDPDDRDTALSVLASLGDSYAAQQAIPLLRDPNPYLQLDAAEFLWKHFPSEVKVCLEGLIEHEASWIRSAAQQLLAKMKTTGKNMDD